MTTLTVGPAEALDLLDRNIGNREVDASRVERFLGLIVCGHFGATPAIELEDGRLVNGQHRLRAIVASGRTVALAVRGQ